MAIHSVSVRGKGFTWEVRWGERLASGWDAFADPATRLMMQPLLWTTTTTRLRISQVKGKDTVTVYENNQAQDLAHGKHTQIQNST